MGTIKGQNLRLFIGGVCVAAAKSCQVHISAATEASSTKDTEGNWEEVEVTGLNWDVQADALVKSEHFVEQGTLLDTEYSGVEHHTVYTTTGAITLPAGKVLFVKSDPNVGEDGTIYLCTGTPPSPTVIAKDADGVVSYANSSGSDMQIYICGEVEDMTVYYGIHDGNYITDFSVGDTVEVKLSVTTTSTGNKNREESQRLLGGSAVITDLSINASNKQAVAYTVKLDGDGVLS